TSSSSRHAGGPRSVGRPRTTRSRVVRTPRPMWRTAIRLSLIVGVIVLWAVTLRPQRFGGPAEFLGGSGRAVAPPRRDRHLVVLRRESSYRRGEIVAYRIPDGQPGAGGRVIHRIVGGNPRTGFVTKGDNNDSVDEFWRPKPSQVIGRVWIRFPAGVSVLR